MVAKSLTYSKMKYGNKSVENEYNVMKRIM